MSRATKAAFVVTLCVLGASLGACGGGGGGGLTSMPPPPAPPPPPPPPPPGNNPNDAEYQASNSATTSNALVAYQAGATGQGVKVAVMDTGINPNLPEFVGRLDPASQDVAANRGLVDQHGHGSMVSGVIAANRDGIYMQGVAYQARILSLNVGDPAGCKPGNDCFLDAALPTAIDLARTNGAQVINMSFGDEEGMTAEIYPAIGRAVDAGIVLVMAAGNAGIADPNSFAVRNVQQEGASGLIIIAGAMDANRNIAGFSNRAGTGPAADFYLTALGVGNATVNQFGAHVNVNGTSFATPTIVGAVALLADAFPNLSGAQIVNLLFTTADDAGAPGVDAIFGRGILNIGRAFQPQGATTLAGSAAAISLVDNGTSSGPMGDASPTAGAIILDGYSRAYVLDLAKTLNRVSQEQPLRQAMDGSLYQSSEAAAGPVSVSITMRRNFMGERTIATEESRPEPDDARDSKLVAATAISRLTDKTAMALGFSQSARSLQQQLAGHRENSFLAAGDPMNRNGFHSTDATSLAVRHDLGLAALTVASERGEILEPGLREPLDRSRYDIRSLTLDRAIGPARVGLGASRLREDRTVLGGRFSPIFSGAGSSTTFLDGSASLDLGRGWNAFASYRHGWTLLPGTGALVDNGRLTSNAAAFDLSKTGLFASGDKLAFRVMQPLRVIGGGMNLNLPVSYDYATGTPAYERRLFSLAPKGREVDFEAAYGFGLFGGYLDLNAYYRTDPGHIAALRNDVGGAVRFTVRQ